MGIINEDDKPEMKKMFQKMAGEVSLLVFVKPSECRFCKETKEICHELADVCDKIVVETYDIENDKDVAEEYGVDKAPAIVVLGEKDYGVRYYGVPAGYEFTGLVEDIIDVGNGTTALSQETKDVLAELKDDYHLQVFVTPTCPYCPRAVRLAHMMAIESKRITADMVESSEFPELAMDYEVLGVPKIIVNEDRSFEGALPEPMFLKKVIGE